VLPDQQAARKFLPPEASVVVGQSRLADQERELDAWLLPEELVGSLHSARGEAASSPWIRTHHSASDHSMRRPGESVSCPGGYTAADSARSASRSGADKSLTRSSVTVSPTSGQ